MIKRMIAYYKKRTLKKKLIVSGIGFVLLVFLVILCIQTSLFFFDNRVGKASDKQQEVLQSDMQKKADESLFTMRINSEIVLEDRNEEAPLFIRNPEENLYDVYVVLFSKENGKTIYKSKVLKPGEGIEKDKLNNLPLNEKHLYIARFYIMEDGKEISNVEYEISIEVKGG